MPTSNIRPMVLNISVTIEYTSCMLLCYTEKHARSCSHCVCDCGSVNMMGVRGVLETTGFRKPRALGL